MSTGPLTQPFTVTLNGTGYGTVQVGPHGCDWHIDTITVGVATNALEATTNVYKGGVGTLYKVDFTNTGSSGDLSDTQYDLRDGEFLTIEWVGGDPGQVATALVRGTIALGSSGGFRV